MYSWLLATSLAAAAPRAAVPATPPPPPVATMPAALERSVVRLTNTAQRADWRTPWNPGRPGTGTGSGFVVAGGRILTNAHVVSDSRNLVIHLHGDANPHPARIVAIGHDCDLALVEPVEPGLLDGLAVLEIGEMPNMGDEVATFGYPTGGRWLSSTRGVVSRIDVVGSAHNPSSYHLAVQTDAAINPGNSGGPVLLGGKVAGVAYQGAGGLENVGYFIPPSIVRHFLADVDAKDGYQGFPRLDVYFANMDAPAARRFAAMGDAETGVRVEFVHPGSPAHGVLRNGDVLLTLDGEPIANDGTFAFAGQRLQMQAIVDRFHVGDRVRARVLRDGARLDIEVPVGRSVYPDRAFESLPSYYIYAGLVFVPLDREYLGVLGSGANNDVLYEYGYRQLEHPDQVLPGRVLLFRRLDHEVNMTLPVANAVLVVDRVNGTAVHTLAEVAAAIAGNTDTHHVIEFAHFDRVAVLDRAQADASNAAILAAYAVPKDRR